MDSKNLNALFTERGFIIKNPSVFIKEADNVDLTELVERLSSLEKKINSSANIVEFAKNIWGKLDELEGVINLDDYARLSDTDKYNAYTNDLKTMRGFFEKVHNFIRAEEEMAFHNQNRFEITRKVVALDHDRLLDENGKVMVLDSAGKTEKALEFYGELQKCNDAYNKAYRTYMEQKKAYNDSVRGFSLVDFKNDLLANINRIQDDCKNLALSPESKEKLQTLISNIRNDIAYYGLESIRSKTEFDSLCKRFGIESVNSKKTEEVKTVKEEKNPEVKEEVVGRTVSEGKELAPVTPVVEKTSKEKVEAVLAKLKKLNPDVEFELAEKPSSERFDGRINASDFVTNLHLPEGFYYMSNGISNKFSNTDEPVVIEVGELKKKKDLDIPEIEEPKKDDTEPSIEESTPGLIDKAKNAINKLRQKGRVESQKKYKVTKSRNALIGSYPKSLLTFSALGAVVGGITMSPVVPFAVIGAGIGAVATTLYRKLTTGTDAKVEELEVNPEEITPENAPGFIKCFYKAGDKLMDIYKKRKSGTLTAKKEEVAPVVVDVADKEVQSTERAKTSEEQIEELSRNIERALSEHQEVQDSIFDDEPSMGGR